MHLLKGGRVADQTVREPKDIEAEAQLEHARNGPEFEEEEAALFRFADRFQSFEFEVLDQLVDSGVQLLLAELLLLHIRRLVEHLSCLVVAAARQ